MAKGWEECFEPELDGDFTVKEIKADIYQLRMHKAADSKDILDEFIRTGRSDLQRPLTVLSFVNLFWDKESVPHNWGTRVIVSLDKAGDSTDPGHNTRILLISIIR